MTTQQIHKMRNFSIATLAETAEAINCVAYNAPLPQIWILVSKKEVKKEKGIPKLFQKNISTLLGSPSLYLINITYYYITLRFTR